MKINRSILAIASLATLMSGSAVSAHSLIKATAVVETITLNDKVNKNQMIWISEAPLENIKGATDGVTGTFTFDPSDVSKIRGTISTPTKTMKTGNATRDNHLVSAEWLDANHYPDITFAITSVESVKTVGSVSTATATGNFTMHGVTKRISVPFKLTYVPESDKTRQRAPGDLVMINADFTISLKDFKVAGQEGTVGSKVGEVIKINAQLFGNATKKSST